MELFILIVALAMVVLGQGKPPDVKPLAEIDPTLSVQPAAFKSSSKDPNVDTYGPPISAEEMAAAIANSSLMQPSTVDNHAIENSGEFEGDIILTPQQQALIEKGGRAAILSETWDKGIIPYKISAAFYDNERQVIARAMAEYDSKTCIKFIDRTTQSDYVVIQPGSGCSSNIGRTGGLQTINLNKTKCFWKVGTSIHELMHTAGFFHEQARTDRDEYVIVHWDNIIEKYKRNFRKYDQSKITHYGLPYDYGSIMHYGKYGFAINDQKPTLSPKKPGVTIGQRDGFSELDVHGLNRLYDCEEVADCTPKCQNGGKCNSDKKCDCPSGWKGDTCNEKTDGEDCTSPWVSIEGINGCFLFVQSYMNWDDARSHCQRNAGDLIILDTKSKRRSMLKYMESIGLRNGRSRHLGANDRSGSWSWVNGQSVNNGWRSIGGEPDNDEGDDTCMYLYTKPDYPPGRYDLLSDYKCTSRRYSICEKDDDCPRNMFRIGNSQVCYKYFPKFVNWYSARRHCQSEGLMLAEPEDDIAVELRKYVLDISGTNYWTWIGGRGNGRSGMVWDHVGTYVSRNLIQPKFKNHRSRSTCLNLATSKNSLKNQPRYPYATKRCRDRRPVLCQGLN